VDQTASKGTIWIEAKSQVICC